MGRTLYVLRFFLRNALLGSIILIFLSNTLVVQQSEGLIYRELAAVPQHRVALLLGTSRWIRGGRPNPFFDNRVAAAVRLYETGKVAYILASGDNSHSSYNEPAYLREALVRSGVPEERVVLDYAGFSTLDSIIRAEKVFGLESLLVVSQAFHLERALFIASASGIEAIGYAAADVEGWGGFAVRAREALARVKAVLDVYVLKSSPRYLGEREYIE